MMKTAPILWNLVYYTFHSSKPLFLQYLVHGIKGQNIRSKTEILRIGIHHYDKTFS